MAPLVGSASLGLLEVEGTPSAGEPPGIEVLRVGNVPPGRKDVAAIRRMLLEEDPLARDCYCCRRYLSQTVAAAAVAAACPADGRTESRNRQQVLEVDTPDVEESLKHAGRAGTQDVLAPR